MSRLKKNTLLTETNNNKISHKYLNKIFLKNIFIKLIEKEMKYLYLRIFEISNVVNCKWWKR